MATQSQTTLQLDFWHQVFIHEITRADRRAENAALKRGRFFNSSSLALMMRRADELRNDSANVSIWEGSMHRYFTRSPLTDKMKRWAQEWQRKGTVPKNYTCLYAQIFGQKG